MKLVCIVNQEFVLIIEPLMKDRAGSVNNVMIQESAIRRPRLWKEKLLEIIGDTLEEIWVVFIAIPRVMPKLI